MFECALIGRIGARPVLKTRNGINFVSLAVCVEDGGGRAGGAWARVICSGPMAERVAREISRDDRCYIEGKITIRKESHLHGGVRREVLSIAATRCDLIGRIGQRREAQQASAADVDTDATPEGAS